MSSFDTRVTANLPVWKNDAGDAIALDELRENARADVCVVGLGGSGLTALLELRALGVDAIGIDAGRIAGGAAGRNAGFLLAGLAEFYHDAIAQLGRERARRLYALTVDELTREFAAGRGGACRCGSLRIAADEAELLDCEQQFAALQADGFPVERYDGPEGRGLLLPGDGVCNPLARCRALAREAMAAGAPLFENSPALTIASGQVRTPRATIFCRVVLVLVDGGLRRIFPQLADRVRTARLQMLATAPEPAMHFPRPVYFRYGFEYWQQSPDGRIALGGLRDRFGESEWTETATPSADLQRTLEQFLRARVGSRAAVTHRWAASVAYTTTGLPFVGEVSAGVWAAGAYSGTGNIVGALCGRALAQLAAGDASAVQEWM